MKWYLIRYVEPDDTVGDEEKTAIPLVSIRRFLTEHDQKGLPAAVIIHPFERTASFSIGKRYAPRTRFNRLGKNDTGMKALVAKWLRSFEKAVNYRPGQRPSPSSRPSPSRPKPVKGSVTSIIVSKKRASPSFEQWLRRNGYRRTRSGWLSPDGKKFFPL